MHGEVQTACRSTYAAHDPYDPHEPDVHPFAVPLSAMDETTKPRVPEKPALEGLETKWQQHWDAAGTFTFDRTKSRDKVFAIDTPPPTVSGSLHIGHVFSYTH